MKKVAIISGGMSGIGRAIALRLREAGVEICIGGRRGNNPDAVSKLHAELGAQVHVGRLDVRDSLSVAEFVDGVVAQYSKVDILINAAAIYEVSAIIDHPDELWDDTIRTNLSGTFKMIRAVMPYMKAQNWGRIINIASVAAHNGMAANAAYCASKAGLLGLGRCVSLEGAAFGITCTSISPTWVETEMLRKYIDSEVSKTNLPIEEIQAKYKASNPQGVHVQPEEIADLVAFLASDAGRAITMEDIQVNAGSLW